jgi:lipopolysaccharide biosynthesis glycosyltransferase
LPAINLVCATDDKWAPYAAAVILSARDSSPPDEEFVFHVLTFGLTSENIGKFEQLSRQVGSEVKVHLVDPALVNDFPETSLTTNTYLRIFIGEILPELEKVLYIDCDTLVLQQLRPLYALDISNCAAAAALDPINDFGSPAKGYCRAIGLDESNFYFNSGVMLINLEHWRVSAIPAKVAAWFETHPNIGLFGDQDPLNAVLQGNVRKISRRWNMTGLLMHEIMYRGNSAVEFRPDMEDAAIIHFAGKQKPWRAKYWSKLDRQFRRYVLLSPWGKDALPPSTLKTEIGRFVAQLRHLMRRVRSIVMSQIKPRPV